MPYKSKIYKGFFEGFFKAKLSNNLNKVANKLPISSELEFFDVQLIDDKKYTITSIQNKNNLLTYDSLKELKSSHFNVQNVETHFSKNLNQKINPINKNWSSLVIINPEFPTEYLNEKSENVYYGKIEGECIHIENIWVNEKPKKIKTDKLETPIKNKSKIINTIDEKGCFDDMYGKDGILSTVTPISKREWFSKLNSSSLLYPKSNSCYGSSLSCFNANPPCFNTCFSGCFPGCFSGCFPGCINSPLIRALFNILGILGLIYLLFWLLNNLSLSSSLIPNLEPVEETELILEDIPIEEEIIEEINDTDTQSFKTGSGNKIYITLGDFDQEDGDVVDIYFNNIFLEENYELTSTPFSFELSNIILNDINTVRLEAKSDGEAGVCTPQIYASNSCQFNLDDEPKIMQLGLVSSNEKQKYGEIYFFIEEGDCLENLE